MIKLFPLRQLDSFGIDVLQEAIHAAPEMDHFRDAVSTVIRAIHGLPEALHCDLRQVEVYLGRTGCDPELLRNRWKVRLEKFESAPSTHAMAVFRGSTARIRNKQWERAAQRVIGALDRNSALCCANAVAGNNGPWSATRQTTIYLVARKKPGRIGELSTDSVNRAIVELMAEREIEAEALVAASRLIPAPNEREEIELAEVPKPITQLAFDAPTCREPGCRYAARPGNFGFCGYHRRVSADDSCREPGCNFQPLDGNYGFCGRHRS